MGCARYSFPCQCSISLHPVEFFLQASPLSAIAVACFLALFALGVVLVASSLTARNLPGRVVRKVEELATTISLMEQNALDLRAQWATTIEQLDAFEASIEKKRRQTAASASKAEAAQNANDQDVPDDPQAQLIAIRQRVYGRG